MAQSSVKKQFRVTDHFLTGEEFHLVRDNKTGILHTHPIPDNLDKYYESDEYLSHNTDQVGLFARLYAFAKAVNLKSKSNLISKYVRNGKHLDIGAGVGDLVKAARDKGIDSEGAEPSPKARTVAKDKGVSLKTSTSVFKDDEVSVITMYHVLEHVPNLDEQISEIDRLLKDEGILILALPNIKSWDAKYFNKYWAGYDVPRHLHHFSKRSIKGLLEKRFQLIETKPMWFDSFYVSILSARYQKRKFPFLQGLALGMISNLSALLTKEPSSITFVLKKRF